MGLLISTWASVADRIGTKESRHLIKQEITSDNQSLDTNSPSKILLLKLLFSGLDYHRLLWRYEHRRTSLHRDH